MALLLKSNAVFLHIPKTGGTFVTKVLEELNLVESHFEVGHANFPRLFWHDRLHADGKVFRNLVRRRLGWLPTINPNAFKFCFVREPLSWYVSYWRFMEGVSWKRWGDEKNPRQWHPCAMLNGLGSSDFNTFMSNVNRKRPGYVTELYGWYVRPDVNFVGKQENLQQDTMKVLSILYPEVDRSVVLKMPPHNETPAHIPRPEWDPAIKRETLRLEYAAYVRYGYPVDEAALVEV